MINLNKNLSTELKNVLSECIDYCKDHGILEVKPVNVLYHIIIQNGSKVSDFLQNGIGVSIPALQDFIKFALDEESKSANSLKDKSLWKSENMIVDKDTERVFRLAETESGILGIPEITPECVFQALIKDQDRIKEILKSFDEVLDNRELYKKSLERFRVTLKEKRIESEDSSDERKSIDDFFKKNSFLNSLKNGGFMDSMKKSFGVGSEEDEENLEKSEENPNPYLSKYAELLNKSAADGKLDRVIGRDPELEQLIQILCCRKKNSAAIIGEAGTGKSALVEHLAQAIVDGKVPEQLKTKEIWSLNVNSLVSGSIYRGQFEKKLEGVIKEILEDPNKILSIDELASIVGAGSSSNTGDMASILKPYLTKNEFQIIGACDYKSFQEIEKDSALRRRFQTVKITEATKEETREILENIKDAFEEFHEVKYSEEAIDACIDYSDKYLSERHFPDKAIDFLDVSGSFVKLHKSSTPEGEELSVLRKELEDARELKVAAVKAQEFEDAAKHRSVEKELEEKIENLKKLKSWPKVGKEDVAEVISKVTGIQMTKITEDETVKLQNLKSALESKVIGQEEAIRQVVKALQKSRLGLKDPNHPISMFMSGSTATGKTYLTKILTKEYFGSEDSFLMIDMSQFSEEHSVTKLVGAPPSYVGYEDTPIFDKVRRMGRGVILFDEAEKASPKVFQTLLQVLDEGKTTLTNGFEVNFKNFIIIFTSNIGTKDLLKEDIGFSTGKDLKARNQEVVKKAIHKFFSPEFINRIDHFITFNSLTHDNLREITKLEMVDPIKRMRENGYEVDIQDKVIEYIITKADKAFGARNIKRLIDTEIIDKITDIILDNTDTTKKKIVVNGTEEEIMFDLK